MSERETESAAQSSGSGSVTVVVRRRVRADQTAAFEAWLRGVIAAASEFQGHLGANVARPRDPNTQDYVLIFRFDSQEHLEAWEQSETRAQWLAEAEPFTVGTPAVEKVSGLEFWFALPGDAATRPPPRYKMAIVTVIAIYPLILFLVPELARLFGFLPRPVAPLASAIVMVSLMTWVVMPLLTRAFAAWLFSGR